MSVKFKTKDQFFGELESRIIEKIKNPVNANGRNVVLFEDLSRILENSKESIEDFGEETVSFLKEQIRYQETPGLLRVSFRTHFLNNYSKAAFLKKVQVMKHEHSFVSQNVDFVK